MERHVGEVLTIEDDVPVLDARDDVEQRGLAAPARPDDRQARVDRSEREDEEHHQERKADHGGGDDGAEAIEGDGDPRGLQGGPQGTAGAEKEQQEIARHGGRQDEREPDDGLEGGRPERPGASEGHGHEDADREREERRRRADAEGEGDAVAHRTSANPCRFAISRAAGARKAS
ncbi:MAG: hypothetical protein AB1726_16680 [Planctomycetota bacterium]